MNSWFRSFIIASPCTTRRISSRLYSINVVVPEPARSKWLLDGVPRPKSILEDDDAKIDLSEDNDIVNGVVQPPDGLLPHNRKPPRAPTPYEHKEHRRTLQKHFPNGWSPAKKLSREAMEGLRQLHRFDPDKFTTPLLAEKFRISPEAVRRILRSKWEPPKEKRIKLVEREREAREQRIKMSRLTERMEARQVEEFKRATEAPLGKDKVTVKDGLTFT